MYRAVFKIGICRITLHQKDPSFDKQFYSAQNQARKREVDWITHFSLINLEICVGLYVVAGGYGRGVTV